MLEDLKIINGKLELPFNKYIYEYTVIVDDNIDSLKFEYNLKDDSYIDIQNNILNDKENLVYVIVYNNEEIETYTFLVYKNYLNYTSNIEDFKKSLEIVNKGNIEIYKLQILACCIFLSIVIVFSIIFHKKKKNY